MYEKRIIYYTCHILQCHIDIMFVMRLPWQATKTYTIIILLFFIFQDVYMPMMFALKMKYVLTVSEKNIDMDVGKIKNAHFTTVIPLPWYSPFYVMYNIKQYFIPILPTMINWGALYYSNSVINCKENWYLILVVSLTYLSWRRSFVFIGTLHLFIYP